MISWLPFGKVIVTVQNDITRGSVAGPFVVSVVGTDKAQTMIVPRGETRTYTKGGDGVKGVVKRTHADGRVETIEYMANTDREYMVTGTPEYDAVKLRQIDPFTSEALLTHGGATFGSATRYISRDGKTMRIVFRRPDADVFNLAVYRKQR